MSVHDLLSLHGLVHVLCVDAPFSGALRKLVFIFQPRLAVSCSVSLLRSFFAHGVEFKALVIALSVATDNHMHVFHVPLYECLTNYNDPLVHSRGCEPFIWKSWPTFLK